jgi:hypothetical protein
LYAVLPVLSRTPPEFGEEGVQEGAKDLAREARVVRTAITKRVWKREHPLADRDFGQNAVDEVCRGLRHPVAAATGTKAPAFARERDEAVEAATITMQVQEPVCEDPAAKEGVELLLDEAGHGMRSMDRRGNLMKDHLCEPLPGTCRAVGTTNA